MKILLDFENIVFYVKIADMNMHKLRLSFYTQNIDFISFFTQNLDSRIFSFISF
jgi:hypothetical protein